VIRFGKQSSSRGNNLSVFYDFIIPPLIDVWDKQ